MAQWQDDRAGGQRGGFYVGKHRGEPDPGVEYLANITKFWVAQGDVATPERGESTLVCGGCALGLIGQGGGVGLVGFDREKESKGEFARGEDTSKTGVKTGEVVVGRGGAPSNKLEPRRLV